jgi:hypothetical protein
MTESNVSSLSLFSPKKKEKKKEEEDRNLLIIRRGWRTKA